MVSPLPIEKSHKSADDYIRNKNDSKIRNYPYPSQHLESRSPSSQRPKQIMNYHENKRPQQYNENMTKGKSIGFVSGLRSMETTHKPITMLRSKVVIVGDSTVGKTALVQAFVNNTFPKNYCMTPHIDFSVKGLAIWYFSMSLLACIPHDTSS